MRKTSLTVSQRTSSEKTGVMRTWAPQSFWYLKCQNLQIHFTKHPLKHPWKCLDVGRMLQRVPPVSAQEYLCRTGGSWLRQNAAISYFAMWKRQTRPPRKARYTWNRRRRGCDRKQTDREQVVVWPHWCDRETQWMSRLGTRQSHATMSLLIFVVLLLFKLGHQPEFATAAAFRIIQHLVL